MNKMNKYIYLFAAFILVIIALFIGFRYTSENMNSRADTPSKTEEVVVTKDQDLIEKKKSLLKVVSGDYSMGKDFAPVLIIEYASLSCPHCAHFEETVVEPLTPNYINTGKVRYVYRDFPLNAQAFAASKLARCAEPEKYFSFIKVLFKSQEQWAYDPQNFMTTLKNIGKLGGVTPENFDKCQADKSLDEKILKVQQEAADVLEVRSTPSIFINGVKYEGEYDYKSVSAAVDKLLKSE